MSSFTRINYDSNKKKKPSVGKLRFHSTDGKPIPVEERTAIIVKEKEKVVAKNCHVTANNNVTKKRT